MAIFPLSGVLRGFAHRKNISFMNWKLLSAQMCLWLGTIYKKPLNG
jgi:hypothetical protein